MSSFGTPSFGGAQTTSPTTPQQTNGVVAQPQPGESTLPIVDENDPRLTSEVLDINPAGDAFASPPPPPDGAYRVRLRLEGFTDQQGNKKDFGTTQTKGGRGNPIIPYYTTGISAVIIDPSGKHDGLVLFPPFGGNVGTLVGRDGSSKVSTILGKIRKADGQYWSQNFQGHHKAWIELFIKAMASEPECGVQTQWEWNCQTCGEEAKASGRPYPK